MDFCRTLEFRKDAGRDAREEFYRTLSETVERCATKLLQSSEGSFHEEHRLACRELCGQAENCTNVLELNQNGEKWTKADGETREDKVFYYGQAQKWLNMTIKYMWLLGLWRDQFEPLMAAIHIPVDSCIVKKVWSDEGMGGIPLPLVNGCKGSMGNRYQYSDDKVISWSKWNEEEYEAFQAGLCAWCRASSKNPLDWESGAWLEMAGEETLLCRGSKSGVGSARCGSKVL